jgi:hypothetical protein
VNVPRVGTERLAGRVRRVAKRALVRAQAFVHVLVVVVAQLLEEPQPTDVAFEALRALFFDAW